MGKKRVLVSYGKEDIPLHETVLTPHTGVDIDAVAGW